MKKKASKKAPKKPVGNGGFFAGQDIGRYKRDTKNRAPSGRAALYTKFDAVTKETIGKSGLELFRAAAAYLTKKTKSKFTPQMFQKRYGKLAAGPQTMAVRASMRGGGKALLAGNAPYKRKDKAEGKKSKRAVAKATKRKMVAKTKSAPKKVVKRAVAKAALTPKPAARKRTSKPRALRTSAPAILPANESTGVAETFTNTIPTVETNPEMAQV